MTLPGKWSILDFKNKNNPGSGLFKQKQKQSLLCVCCTQRRLFMQESWFSEKLAKKKKNSNFLLLLFLFCFTSQNFTVQPRLAWSFGQPSVSVSEHQITDGSPKPNATTAYLLSRKCLEITAQVKLPRFNLRDAGFQTNKRSPSFFAKFSEVSHCSQDFIKPDIKIQP